MCRAGRTGGKVKCTFACKLDAWKCVRQEQNTCLCVCVRESEAELWGVWHQHSDIVKHITFQPLCTTRHISPFYWSWCLPLYCNYTMETRGLQTKAACCWRHQEFILLSWQPECWWTYVPLALCFFFLLHRLHVKTLSSACWNSVEKQGDVKMFCAGDCRLLRNCVLKSDGSLWEVV